MINYVAGDATRPRNDGNNHVIAHVVNNRHAWGAGFTKSLTERWPRARTAYDLMTVEDMRLGNNRPVRVESYPHVTHVVHMVAQDGLRSAVANPRPLRYDALGACLMKLGDYAIRGAASVHMPRIGCGLAGGFWPTVEVLVEDALCRRGVDVFVYDLPLEATRG